jgi:hypothetical protein
MSRTAVYGPVRTVVWQGSAGDRRPYADQTPQYLRILASVVGKSASRTSEFKLRRRDANLRFSGYTAKWARWWGAFLSDVGQRVCNIVGVLNAVFTICQEIRENKLLVLRAVIVGNLALFLVWAIFAFRLADLDDWLFATGLAS